MRMLKRLFFLLKYKGNLSLGRNVNIGINSLFGGNNAISENSYFSGAIGYSSYIGKNCAINANIGKFCSIANDVTVITGNHPTREFVTTSPLMYSTASCCKKNFTDRRLFFEEIKYADSEKKVHVNIGNDVWIGAFVRILGGVNIGDGAVIGAGSVVVKDVPPYAIVGGNPAKIIRYRFSEEDIAFLENLKWWDKPDDWLRRNSELFTSVTKLKEKISEQDNEV